MCFTLRLHMSAAPPQGGLTQALGLMRKRFWPFVIGILLLAVAAYCSWLQASAFIASDACLDAGGSFNYSAAVCDFKQSHPHIPFYSSWSFWLAAVATLSGFWAIGHAAAAHEA